MLILALFVLATAAKTYVVWRLLPLRILIPALQKRKDPAFRIICDPIAQYTRSMFTGRMYIKRFQLLPVRAPLDRSGMAHQWNWLWWNIQFCDGTTCPVQSRCKVPGCCRSSPVQD